MADSMEENDVSNWEKLKSFFDRLPSGSEIISSARQFPEFASAVGSATFNALKNANFVDKFGQHFGYAGLKLMPVDPVTGQEVWSPWREAFTSAGTSAILSNPSFYRDSNTLADALEQQRAQQERFNERAAQVGTGRLLYESSTPMLETLTFGLPMGIGSRFVSRLAPFRGAPNTLRSQGFGVLEGVLKPATRLPGKLFEYASSRAWPGFIVGNTGRQSPDAGIFRQAAPEILSAGAFLAAMPATSMVLSGPVKAGATGSFNLARRLFGAAPIVTSPGKIGGLSQAGGLAGGLAAGGFTYAGASDRVANYYGLEPGIPDSPYVPAPPPPIDITGGTGPEFDFYLP